MNLEPVKSSSQPLRVGLLVDSLNSPAWVKRVIERIKALEGVELALVVVGYPSMPAIKPKGLRTALFRRYMRYESKRRVDPETNAFAPKSLEPLLEGVPRVAADEVASKSLDVLIQLGDGAPKGALLRAARHGTWALKHGCDETQRGEPEGFWEVFSGEAISGASLKILGETSDKDQTLSRTYSHTTPILINHGLSSIYWKTLSLVPRQLELLRRLGHDEFKARVERDNTAPVFCSHPYRRVPTNLEFIPLFLKHMVRYVKQYIKNFLCIEQWELLFDFRDELSTSLSRFKRIVPPRDRIWADPCVIERDGRYQVFIEEYLWKDGRGHISTFEIDENGNWTEPRKVLARPYHLSYPHVFQWDGNYYMIPETLENNAIELYRCESFPDKWVFDRVLIKDIRAADTTLLEHEGRWWLFANVIENHGASSWDELFLYSADNPLSSEWTPHPLNPIVSDVRRARPGGKVLKRGGNLYRPAQDCSNGYGSGMRVLRIDRLTPTEYHEVEVSRIEPRWEPNLVGTHTLAYEGRLTMIDAIRCRARYFG